MKRTNHPGQKARLRSRKHIRCGLLLGLFGVAVLLLFLRRKSFLHAQAPKVAASRSARSSVMVRTQSAQKDGGLAEVGLSMDEVPASYTYEPAESGTIEKFWYTTNTYGLYGRAEKEIRKYAEVYLPYGYDPSERYPVFYLMHGAGGSAERFFGSSLQPKELKYVVDNMIALGEIRPMIFVGLTYYPKQGQQREDDWDAEYTKGFVDELRRDVLPQVESHYSTFAETVDEAGLRASRWQRSFGGFSMGSVTTYTAWTIFTHFWG